MQTEFYSFPVDNLMDMVAKYVRHIESATTVRAGCTCEWIMHPDDGGKPEEKRRWRRGEASLDCPAHTKEGFLLGFFKWAFPEPIEEESAESALASTMRGEALSDAGD